MRKKKPISPKKFAEGMKKLQSSDNEAAHSDMDNLMCELLKSLGYTEGVEVFQNQQRWYA